MATNREAAEESLKAVSLAGLLMADEPAAANFDAADLSAKAGIIAALLDVADAIREQTTALTTMQDTEVPY